MSRIPPSLVVRAVLYGSALCYLAADLYFWHGPLRHVLDSLRAGGGVGAEAVVAAGDGFTITLGQTDAEMAARWSRGGAATKDLPRNGPALRDLRRTALDDLVAVACLDRQSPSVVDPAARDRILAEAAARFGGPDALTAVLSKAGITADQFVATMAREEFRRKWWDDHLAAARPTDQEIRAWWDREGATAKWPRRVKLRHLFKASLHQDNTVLKQKMDDWHAKLVADPSLFGSLVAAESDDESTKRKGGDLGWVEESPDRLPAGVDFSALAAAAPGTLLAPMASRLGWHIFLVEGVEAAHPATFEEMRPQIEALLTDRQRAEAMTRLRQELRSAAHVEMFPDRLEAPITLNLTNP